VGGSVLGEAVLDPLLEYWSSKRAGRIMPERPEIDPVELGPALLPHLMITEFLEHGRRVRVRLCGTAAVARLGCDPTGRGIEQVFNPDFRHLLLGLHREVHRHATPVFSEWMLAWKDGRSVTLRLLLLPLALRRPASAKTPAATPAQTLLGVRAHSSSRRTPSWCGEVALAQSQEIRRIVFVEFAARHRASA
jgi:hypothetical protein